MDWRQAYYACLADVIMYMKNTMVFISYWGLLFVCVLAGMAEVDCNRVVDLAEFLNPADYTIYDGVQGRISSTYTIDEDGDVTEHDGGQFFRLPLQLSMNLVIL